MATQITYNGVTSELDAGKTATLGCNGKKMKSDISVVFGSDGSITYNGTQTDVDTGKTATIHCGGKKMLSDLVIAMVEMASDKIVYDGDVQLPPIPADLLKQYPYAWIRKNTTSGYYDLLMATGHWYYFNADTLSHFDTDLVQWYRVEIATASNATEWTYNTDHDSNSWGCETGRDIIWAHYDILMGVTTNVGFKGEKSVDVENLKTISGTWVFNDTITSFNMIEVRVNCTFPLSDKPTTEFSLLYCDESAYIGTLYLYVRYYTSSNSGTNVDIYCYKGSNNTANYWEREKYKTIAFTNNNIVTQEFYDWFTANATQQ